VIGVKVDYFGGYVNNNYDGRRRARAYEYASMLTSQLLQTRDFQVGQESEYSLYTIWHDYASGWRELTFSRRLSLSMTPFWDVIGASRNA
jgi:hypothetical protein